MAVYKYIVTLFGNVTGREYLYEVVEHEPLSNQEAYIIARLRHLGRQRNGERLEDPAKHYEVN
jgi:hypothetical protein